MFNNTSQELPHVAAELSFPAIARPGVRDVSGSRKEDQHIGPVTYNYEFLNYFSMPITVVDRNGFRHTVAAKADHRFKQCFIVRLRVTFGPESWTQMDTLLAGLPSNKYEILQGCKEHWERLRQTTPFGHHGRVPTKTITLDFVVEANMLFDKKSVYVRQADVVISRLDLLQAPPHPMHPDAAHVQKIPHSQSSGHETSIQYELVEGEKPLAPRYVMVSGRLFTIVPKKDSRRQEGLYVTYVDKDPGDYEQVRTVQERYTIEELETTLGIYRNAEDAQAAGDVKTARREELAKLEHNTAILRSELDETKTYQTKVQTAHETEMRSKEHERKVEAFEMQAKIIELERMNKISQEMIEQERFRAAQETARIKEEAERRIVEVTERAAMQKSLHDERSHVRKDSYEERAYVRKDHYDERSRDRSDSSEMVKFLPAIVLGIGALVLAGLKFLSGK